MKHLVVDSCVIVNWYFVEGYSKSAVKITDGSYILHAPDFFHLEVANILIKRIRRKELSAEKGKIIQSSLPKLAIEHHDTNELIDSAFSIASSSGSSLYDCIYLALAFTQECKMITSDKRLYKNISDSSFRKHILWIEDVDQID